MSSADRLNFANSLDPDQDGQNGSKRFDTLKMFMKEFFENVNFGKSQQTTTKNTKNAVL